MLLKTQQIYAFHYVLLSFLLCTGRFTSWYDGMRNPVSECRVLYGLFIHVFIYFLQLWHYPLICIEVSHTLRCRYWIVPVRIYFTIGLLLYYFTSLHQHVCFTVMVFYLGNWFLFFIDFYLFLVWVVWSLLKSSTVNYSAIKFFEENVLKSLVSVVPQKGKQSRGEGFPKWTVIFGERKVKIIP